MNAPRAGRERLKSLIGPRLTVFGRCLSRGLPWPRWGNWRLSADGWRRVLEQEWPACDIAVEAHGNCLAVVAAMYGLAQEELNRDELDAHDPRYPVLITIRGRKPAVAS